MLSEKNMDFLCFPLGNRMDKDLDELNSPLMTSQVHVAAPAKAFLVSP